MQERVVNDDSTVLSHELEALIDIVWVVLFVGIDESKVIGSMSTLVSENLIESVICRSNFNVHLAEDSSLLQQWFTDAQKIFIDLQDVECTILWESLAQAKG